MLNHWADRIRTKNLAFLHDLLVVPCAWVGAYWLRYNLMPIQGSMVSDALDSLLYVVLIQASAFWYFGLYRGVWRFASVPDLWRILQASVIGTISIVGVLFVATRLEGVPRSVPVLYALLLVLGLCGPRFFYRWLKDHRLRVRAGRRVLIVGAGRAGEMLARDLLRDSDSDYHIVGFVDDDPKKWSREIHGLRVLGGVDLLPDIVRRYQVEVVLLAVPSANAKEMRRLVQIAEQASLPIRTIPQLKQLMSGQVMAKELREVSIEDLLGRDPVSLDWDAIQCGLAGRNVLVTGGGGSIGSELCRQIVNMRPAKLIVIDHSEYNLYKIDSELTKMQGALEIVSLLCDVTDAIAVNHIMDQHRPNVVFHAAAYKHVPLLEGQVRQAVANNILGTKVIADAANAFKCGEFVLISTDKAVNPANIMGASKRIAEIYCQNLNLKSDTKYITVRFGNVLGSAGSVVPLFRKQIESGGPVTVTHPEITRYFMTIPEACQLIMQASVMGDGGEIFVLDMGEPIKIKFLAEQMILLSGKEPEKDIIIKYIGLRPGEKLYEELFHEKEKLSATHHSKILLAQHRQVEWQALIDILVKMQLSCDHFDEMTLMEQIKQLVPELHSPETDIGNNVVKLESQRRSI